MRVVVAPDSFGTTLTAAQAADAIARGWASARPGDEIVCLPQSDGGPGFLACLAGAGVGQRREATVSGPLGAGSGGAVSAAWLVDGASAYLECAQACGLHLIENPDPETALRATTEGVGELLLAALAEPVQQIVVGLGGSATTDGGQGLLDALGGYAAAARLLGPRDLVVATDVDNPLTGPRGAAAVFSPQKGADAATVEVLEARLVAVGAELDELADRPVSAAPGAGAAGGLGAALFALGGHRVSGADLVAGTTGLVAAVRGADIVLTGEGRLDEQTAGGKVVARVAALAEDGTTVIALVGDATADGSAVSAALGLTAVESLIDHVGRDAALGEAASALDSLAATVAARVSAPGGGARE